MFLLIRPVLATAHCQGVLCYFQSLGSRFLKSPQVLDFGSFIMRTVVQAGQQTYLSLSTDALVLSVFCFREMQVQD